MPWIHTVIPSKKVPRLSWLGGNCCRRVVELRCPAHAHVCSTASALLQRGVMFLAVWWGVWATWKWSSCRVGAKKTTCSCSRSSLWHLVSSESGFVWSGVLGAASKMWGSSARVEVQCFSLSHPICSDSLASGNSWTSSRELHVMSWRGSMGTTWMNHWCSCSFLCLPACPSSFNIQMPKLGKKNPQTPPCNSINHPKCRWVEMGTQGSAPSQGPWIKCLLCWCYFTVYVLVFFFSFYLLINIIDIFAHILQKLMQACRLNSVYSPVMVWHHPYHWTQACSRRSLWYSPARGVEISREWRYLLVASSQATWDQQTHN